jgi:hypothetical protein
LCHQRHAGCIVDHRQVFIVLLSAARRQDHRLENTSLQRFAKLLPRAFPQQYLPWIHVGASSGLDIGEGAAAGEGSDRSSGQRTEESAAACAMVHW